MATKKTKGGGGNRQYNISDHENTYGWTLHIPLLLLFLIVILLLLFIYNILFVKNTPSTLSASSVSPISKNSFFDFYSKTDPFNDPYTPPLKNDGTFFPLDRDAPSANTMATVPSMDGVATNRAINVQTRGYMPEFTQIGILTNPSETGNGNEPKILPLMGRRIMNGRDKYQYYTISNSGNVNTKLPVRKNGRNCIGEYGCDELYDGEYVMVDGYGIQFKTTIYENGTFRYIPR